MILTHIGKIKKQLLKSDPIIMNMIQKNYLFYFHKQVFQNHLILKHIYGILDVIIGNQGVIQNQYIINKKSITKYIYHRSVFSNKH